MKTIEEFEGGLKEILDSNKELINEECDTILKSINLYYKGLTFEAYEIFRKCINKLKPYLPIQKLYQTKPMVEITYSELERATTIITLKKIYFIFLLNYKKE